MLDSGEGLGYVWLFQDPLRSKCLDEPKSSFQWLLNGYCTAPSHATNPSISWKTVEIDSRKRVISRMDTRRGRCLLDLQPGACWAHPHFQGMQHMQHVQHVQHSSCPNSPLYALVMRGFDPDLMSPTISVLCVGTRKVIGTQLVFSLTWAGSRH